MSEPWLKFYPTDWRSDPALRMCGLAARGLWIEMIALMHEAVPYGHLLVSGRSPTDAQLAVLAGTTPDQIPELLGELDAAGVFSRTKEGVIYSRKMTRIAKKSAIARKNGKSGGNPALRKDTENPSSDNQEDKGGLKTQIPEARSQTYSEADASAAPNFREEVWDRGVAYLTRRGSKPDRARTMVGRWLKESPPDQVFAAFDAASREGVAEPISWITARLASSAGRATAPVVAFDLSKFKD